MIAVLKLILCVCLIVYLFKTGKLDINALFRIATQPLYFLLGALCCFLAMLFPIFRWWILTRLQKLTLGFFDAIRLTMIGLFFNVFIPGGTGGDIIRAAYTVRENPERRAQALTIAFVDRGLGLHALLVVCISSFLVEPAVFNNYPALKPWLCLITGMLFIGTIAPLLLVWDRTNGLMIRLCGRAIGGADSWRESMKLYRKQPTMLLAAYSLSIGSALFNVLAIHFMMVTVGSTPTIVESLFITPLVIFANTIPLTPGGIGMAEGACAGLYALIGEAGGANGMMLTRIFIVFFALLGLPFYLISKDRP